MSGGPNVFAVNVLAGYTLNEVANAVDDVPATAGTPSSPWPRAARSLTLPGGRRQQPEGRSAGVYQVLPGETDTTLLEDMVNRFVQQAQAAGLTPASASALGMTEYQVITVASIVQKEGYLAEHGPGGPGHLQPGGPGDPAADGLDGAVLPRPGRRPGDPGRLKRSRVPTTPTSVRVSPRHRSASRPPRRWPPPVTAARSWLFFVVVDKSGTEAFADTYAEQRANEQLAQSRGLG